MKRDLVVTRIFDAPLEQVWKAWTDPDLIMCWWGPVGFTSPSAKIDFRVGGTSLVCMRMPNGPNLYNTWLYKKIEPMKLIEFVQNLADQDGNTADPASMGMPPDFPLDMRSEVAFRDLGNGKTELIATEFDWTVGPMHDMSKAGLEQCLDKMAECLK